MEFIPPMELNPVSNIFYIHRDAEEVKQSHYRPGQAQGFPGSLGSQIS